MEYPFEGDLAAVFEAVAVPRICRDALTMTFEVFGLPDVSAEVDEIFGGLSDELWWAQRMAERRG
jgi:hypothetical protein